MDLSPAVRPGPPSPDPSMEPLEPATLSHASARMLRPLPRSSIVTLPSPSPRDRRSRPSDPRCPINVSTGTTSKLAHTALAVELLSLLSLLGDRTTSCGALPFELVAAVHPPHRVFVKVGPVSPSSERRPERSYRPKSRWMLRQI
ncbi:hypothetical protein M6B38_375010 [Iris pallida]|uniref:Uncharacterized protein n=1 Tax=Iris pallida TaxID=29817 RepID=A0AAX6GCJ1_IRIPA|nr:hypothetical protein M6B38_375010 [Iris pallida]